MKILAAEVYPDEPAYGIRERVVTIPMPDGSQQRRWVQSVFVIRGDAIACYDTDCGPAEQFAHVAPLYMPSFGDDTVAQLREEALRHRASTFPRQHLERVQHESTLMQDVVTRMEERSQEIRNRSVIGPHLTKQRGGYSQERTQRILKEKTHG